jgi:rod shape-determining protein MreD
MMAWRQLRPGLLPVWAGLPLGLFDDLYSGQPFGSAMLLWSIAMIIMELIEDRFPWRNFVIDWLVTDAMTAGYLLLCVTFANLTGGHTPPSVLVPQLVLSILVFPLVGRIVAWFDRMRLVRFRSVD